MNRRVSSNQNQQVYNNLPCAYFSTIPNGIIVECNNLFLSLTGYKEQEVIGVLNIQDFLPLGGKIYFETHYAPLLRMQGEVKDINFDFIRKDGSKFPILINSTRINDDAGNLVLTKSTFFDITQRKNYESELIKAKEQGDEKVDRLLSLNEQLQKQSLRVEEQKKRLEELNLHLQKKNQELSIIEKRYNLFFESSKNLMSTHDLDGNLRSVNADFLDTLGYSREEILRLSLKDLIPKEYQSQIAPYLRSIKKVGSVKGELFLLHKNASIRNLIYSTVLATDAQGNQLALVNAVDITKRYEAEKDLRRSNELLNQINRAARIGGWEYNIETQKFFASQVTRELVGIAPDYEMSIDKGTRFFKEGKHRDNIISALQKAMTTGESFDLEVPIIDSQGKELWTRTMWKTETKDGKPIRLFGILQDIDDKKRREIAANRTRILLENILNSAKDVGIVVVDNDHTIKAFNSGAENLFGYKEEEVIGSYNLRRFHLEKEMTARGAELEEIHGRKFKAIELVSEYSKLGRKDSNEWTCVRKDGSILTVQLMLSELKDQDGIPIGYLGITVDVSDLKSAKSSLEILANNLQKKNHQLLNFAHITSHNLRSPVSNLNSLLAFYNESTNKEDKEFLFTKFKKVIHHLSQTLNQLIESLKIQEDMNRKVVKLSFKEVFDKTKEILAGQIIENKVVVTSDFTEVGKIKYPRSYLESIVLNLFSNAIKYRASNRIPMVHFQTIRSSEGIVLTATDNGLGIDLKRHGHKLFGLNKTFHRNSEAKGVGLFITKTQVEAMGGRISATSEVNKGTTFKITFTNN